MRTLFIVQGEGRGHLTQAIALAQILQAGGHEVLGAWVDVAPERPLPSFFTEAFPAPITPIAGPLLVYNPETNALDWLTTVRGIVQHWRLFRQSMRQLRDSIEQHRPDVVVNFFELLGGLTYGFYKPSAPMVCIGHQCLIFHAKFPFPKGHWAERMAFKWLVRLNAWGATERFGLSFDEQPDELSERLRVMPPLLRTFVVRPAPADAPAQYILAYTTQPGMVDELRQTHHDRPEVSIQYFSAATHPDHLSDATFCVHPIDGPRYQQAMQHAQAVMTTAGFESICEAMYWGKPVQLRPQPNHFEQACNALDGQRAGAGEAVTQFDLPRLLTYIPTYSPDISRRFRAWQAQGAARYVAALQRVAAGRT